MKVWIDGSHLNFLPAVFRNLNAALFGAENLCDRPQVRSNFDRILNRIDTIQVIFVGEVKSISPVDRMPAGRIHPQGESDFDRVAIRRHRSLLRRQIRGVCCLIDERQEFEVTALYRLIGFSVHRDLGAFNCADIAFALHNLVSQARVRRIVVLDPIHDDVRCLDCVDFVSATNGITCNDAILQVLRNSSIAQRQNSREMTDTSIAKHGQALVRTAGRPMWNTQLTEIRLPLTLGSSRPRQPFDLGRRRPNRE